MKRTIKKELKTYTELYWWNFGKKTLSYKGSLKELLEHQGVRYSKKKTSDEGIFEYTFKDDNGITYKETGGISSFRDFAKIFIQMQMVRMGDKAKLYVEGTPRPNVTVNF